WGARASIIALSLNSLLKRNNLLLIFTKDFNVLTEMPAWLPAVKELMCSLETTDVTKKDFEMKVMIFDKY
ncbi:hypothetical protein L9F63_017941, partial [Diploptera punctata]